MQSFANCFEKHLIDSIKLNKSRKYLYSKLSSGRSEKISRMMIWSERLARISAKYFDKKAQYYRNSNIPIFCKDFLSMDLVSDFKERGMNPEKIEKYKRVDAKRIKQKLFNALKLKRFKGLEAAALKLYKRLNTSRTYYSMTKHTLETIINSSRLAKIYIKKAQKLNRKDPTKLLEGFLKLLIRAIPFSSKIDHLSAPLQAEGLLIITQDVPHYKI